MISQSMWGCISFFHLTYLSKIKHICYASPCVFFDVIFKRTCSLKQMQGLLWFFHQHNIWLLDSDTDIWRHWASICEKMLHSIKDCQYIWCPVAILVTRAKNIYAIFVLSAQKKFMHLLCTFFVVEIFQLCI